MDFALSEFALIETLRWEPDPGFIRGARHLARLEESASRLGFSFDRKAVDAALQEAAAGSSALRVRVELAHDSAVSVTTVPFKPLPGDAVWRLRLAETRLDSRDALLAHKTTRRDVYEAARAEFDAGEADEVVLSNERAELCEGTITNLFVRMEPGAPLLTPPIGCGLLPGVLRGELLEGGEACEAMLTADDLSRAALIFCGNSLRGLIPAALA